MSPAKLKMRFAYYRLTFADLNRTIPGVQPLIYVGSTFPGDDPDNRTYYFQHTTSPSWRGPVTDAAHSSKHSEIETAVFPHTEPELQGGILTLRPDSALADCHDIINSSFSALSLMRSRRTRTLGYLA
jgi:hypothetical protein